MIDRDKNKQQLRNYIASHISISNDVMDHMMRIFSDRLYKKGEYFSKQGELSRFCGFVCEGIFAMHILNDDGSQYIKTFITGRHFMLATFKPEEQSTINIQAMTDALVMQADYSVLETMFEKYPSLGLFAKVEIEKYLESAYRKLEEFATKDAKDRYLLFLREFPDVADQIPQYHIASYLGITPTQLSRIRKAMNLEK